MKKDPPHPPLQQEVFKSASADQDQESRSSSEVLYQIHYSYGRAIAMSYYSMYLIVQQLGGVGALERFRCNWCRMHVHVMCQ